MKYSIVIVFLLVLGSTSIFSQSEYDVKVAEAWAFYSNKEWKDAGLKYLEAFEIKKEYYSVNDKYNAGKAFSEAGMMDEAFDQFFYLAKKRKYSNYLYITESDDLKAMKKDSRWADLVGIVKQNKENSEVGMDAEVLAILDEIRVEYDKLKNEITELGKEKGYQSEEMVALRAAQKPLKEEHLTKIKELMDEKGFLGPEEVGKKNRNTVFNILRTSKIETHDEYLPVFEEAFSKERLTPNQYASIIDRISLMHEDRQVYGTIFNYNNETETYYILPVKDPENVNKRRAKIGEMTIEKFCGFSNMVWDVDEHIKMSIEYDKTREK